MDVADIHQIRIIGILSFGERFYFCFRHASITDGAFVAESGRSIHGSSASVLGEAAQYRTEGIDAAERESLALTLVNISRSQAADDRDTLLSTRMMTSCDIRIVIYISTSCCAISENT